MVVSTNSTTITNEIGEVFIPLNSFFDMTNWRDRIESEKNSMLFDHVPARVTGENFVLCTSNQSNYLEVLDQNELEEIDFFHLIVLLKFTIQIMEYIA